jgi:hypothetical protein
MSNSGRKQDPIWIHYEKVKTPDKAGVRAVCKVCRHELQGIPERLKKHAANCTGPPTPALQGLAVAATETGTSSQSEQQQRVETVVDQNDVVVMEVEPLSTSSSASAAVKRPVHGQLAAGTLAAKIPKLNYGLQNYVIRTSAEKRGELDRDVARMVYATNSPFRLVENRHFINLVKDLRPGYQPPSRKDIGGKYLDVIYTEEREKARKNLEGELVCLALDGWSNIHNEPIVCATVTTCLGDIYLVDTTDTSGHPHTAEYLYDIAKQTIENTHNDFGCIICSIVTDNAANVAKMREFLKERLGFNMIAYGCTPHLLNLTSKDLEMGNVKEHVTQVVKYFRNNHFASAQIRQSSCRKLVMPADTRWNTMYDCLNSYCEAWPTLVTICDGHTDRIDVAIANKVRNVVIKRSADEYRLCLKPVACALDKAQSDNCTIAEAVELWKDVKTALHNDTNNSTKRAADKRYQQAVTPHHMLANLLHPKYRGRNLTQQERETALTVASEIPGLMTLVIKFEAMAPPFHILKFNDEVVNGVTSLHWWKSHRRDFEDDLLEAFEFTQRLMSAVAASAGVERVFSSYGLVQSKLRNKLGTLKAAKLVFLFRSLNCDKENDFRFQLNDDC